LLNFVIFIQTLSQFFIYFNFFQLTKTSLLKSGLSKTTNQKFLFFCKVQTKILSALEITFFITASFLLLKIFIEAKTSSQSKAFKEFFQ
jgi:hypothetical protein